MRGRLPVRPERTIPLGFVGTLGPPSKVERDVPSRIETHRGVDALVHHPEIVVLVVADAVTVPQSVHALADLAEELATRVELEQLRRRVTVDRAGRRAARMVQDRHMALRIYGHTEHLAQIHVGRILQKVSGGIERDFGRRYDPRRRGSRLALRGRPGAEQRDREGGGDGRRRNHPALHEHPSRQVQAFNVRLAFGARQIRDDIRELGIADFSLARDRHAEQTAADDCPDEIGRKIGALLDRCRQLAFVLDG